MLYHEVSKVVFRGYQKLQEIEEERNRTELFNEYRERIEALYAAICFQYERIPNGFEPPDLAYNVPIVGVAEEAVRELERWVKEI